MHSNTDIVVIGGGHAGLEAAHAASTLGMKVTLACVRADRIGWMPCNPSIGGPAKGHLTREIDALGGLQGIITDSTSINVRWLNTKKGPAVRALRAQCDKPLYASVSRKLISSFENIIILEGIVTEILSDESRVTGVKFENGDVIDARTVILASGTFLGGMIFRGEERIEAGREGERSAAKLPVSLRKLGLHLSRLKTGTVPRIFRDSIDFKSLEIQEPDPSHPKFSFLGDVENNLPRLPCYITHTTEKTREIIQDNLHRAALFSGDISGPGPRYCPSIEDKYQKFPEKIQHPVFLEPEAASGALGEEVYLQGLSTSLPADVQDSYVRSVPGLENARIARYGYAIEYDYIDPLSVHAFGASKKYPNLFLAGQVLGTTGYEEAAGLGLMCGINAARMLLGVEPVVLGRDKAYIGVMTDDLATRGITDPYRMLTGRAEWRLLLRFDDADRRLTPLGRDIGLVDDRRWAQFRKRGKEIQDLTDYLENTTARAETVAEDLENGKSSRKLSEWLKIPGIQLSELITNGLVVGNWHPDTVATVEAEIKYKGYLTRQLSEVRRLSRSEKVKIPLNFRYDQIESISRESREKLELIKPLTLGQAARISGVKPSDIAVLDILLSNPKHG